MWGGRQRRLAGLAALLMAVGACSGGGGSDGATSTTGERTTSSAADVEAEVTAAYLVFWDAVFAAHSPPNPDHPALQATATGSQLERSREVAAEDQREGIATREGDPPTEHRPQVREVVGNAAVVVDCWLDTDVLYRLDTGEVVDDRQVWTYGEFRLVREDGAWKVDSTANVRELEAGETCEQLLSPSL